MDFTREPIIETVITPKEGCKIVVRSSKTVGQEEYFVDAVEVVSFGNSFFFRSLERPKAFLVPATDYEILEVRETRMVLKSVGLDRSIKIGGGKEQAKPPKESQAEKEKVSEAALIEAESKGEEAIPALKGEGRLDKKRDRRRHYRRKRGREEKEDQAEDKEEGQDADHKKEEKRIDLVAPLDLGEDVENLSAPLSGSQSTSLFSSLLAPPPTLISETIALYKENELFKNVFFMPKKEQKSEDEEGKEPSDETEKNFNEEEDEFERDTFRELEQLEISLPPLEEDLGEDLGIYHKEEIPQITETENPTEEEEEEYPPKNHHTPSSSDNQTLEY